MTPAAYRERIYNVFAEPGRDVDSKIQEALEIGTAYLELPIGHYTRIEEGIQRIVLATGDHPLIQPGETCSLEDAYCRRTVEIESPLAVQDARVSTEISDDAVGVFELGTYIGARIVVDGEVHGTVCFADEATRDAAFSDSEAFFVELLARLLSHTLERQDYERRVAEREAEVKTKEAVNRAVVDSSFDLVFQIDEAGQFSYVSETVEELLGYPSETYIGEPFISMLPDQETIEIAEEVYLKVLANNTVEREYFPLQHKNGDRVPVDIRVTPLYSGEISPREGTEADIVGVQGMARDARGRRRSQRMIRVLNRVLRHNLRNDMNVISGYAEVLHDRLDGAEAEFVGKVRETSERLVSLGETARQLETNLDEPPELEPADVVPVVTRVVAQTEERYPDVSITVDAPDSATALSAPSLETAVSELVENAARHAGDTPSIAIDVTESDDTVSIRICDDGPGLPDQERAVLVSGEETPLIHGSGLGLWLVHWIIGSLDGTVTVEDEGAGTCITLTLQAPAEDT